MKKLAGLYAVLADEARLGILRLLMNSGELCVCDIQSALGFTQSKASRHLGILEAAGLVEHRRQGLWAYYSMAGDQDPLCRQQVSLLRMHLSSGETASARNTNSSGSCCRQARGRTGSSRKE